MEKPSQVRFDISIITYAEGYAGLLHTYEPKQQEQAFLAFIKFKTVYPITRSIAKQYARLRNELASKVRLIDQPDLFIAATAIHHHLTLVTRNFRNYLSRLFPQRWLHYRRSIPITWSLAIVQDG